VFILFILPWRPCKTSTTRFGSIDLSPPSWSCIILALYRFSYTASSAGQLPREMHSRSMFSTNSVCVSCRDHRVWNDDVRQTTEQRPLSSIDRASLPVRPHCASARRNRCKEDLNSFSPGELEETTRTPLYHMDEDCPAGPGIISPLPKWSSRLGSKLPTREIYVYIWCYALVVVHARNEWIVRLDTTADKLYGSPVQTTCCHCSSIVEGWSISNENNR